MLTERYVDDFVAALEHMEIKQKKELVSELEERIRQGFSSGKSDKEIIATLGSPKELAALMTRKPAKVEEEEKPLRPITIQRTLLSVLLFFIFFATLWPVLLAFIIFLGALLVAAMVLVAGGVFILVLNFVAPIWPDIIQGLHYGVAANTLLAIAWICFGLLLCIFLNRLLRAGAGLAGKIWRFSLRLIFYRKRRKK